MSVSRQERIREHAMPAEEGLSEGSSRTDRRDLLKNAGLAAVSAMVGAAIPFYRTLSEGIVPVAHAQQISIPGKDGLTLLEDRPLNAETPAHLLDDPITPTERHFLRNNGQPPVEADPASWTLTIDGLVDTPLNFTIEALQQRFEIVTEALVIECGGNGRAFFDPPASGAQWTHGAVSCSRWTGVRLADVLSAAGVKDNVIYTGHEGADKHLSESQAFPLSRGIPIAKAMNPHTLIAFAQNDAPIHHLNGAPLRLVVPGWSGSCSQKWLTRIQLRDVVHDGAKMNGTSYRVPNRPVAPGEEIAEKDFVIIEAMPVKSLITHPAAGTGTTERALEVRGHAWAGDTSIRAVDISVDFGATWASAELDNPVNLHAWQNWRAEISFPVAGYYEVWARATDNEGIAQPHGIAWNPRGYLNNSMHRVGITVG